MAKTSKPAKRAKKFEPDPDIGDCCRICGAIYYYRVTVRCRKCNKKTVLNCASPAEAILAEDQVANGTIGVKHASSCVGSDIRVRRWRTHEHHHLSYRDDITVLLCYLCHQRLHGNAAITHHPFKKEYAKDIEPFIFAAHVTSLYVENLPELRERAVSETKWFEERKLTDTSH